MRAPSLGFSSLFHLKITRVILTFDCSLIHSTLPQQLFSPRIFPIKPCSSAEVDYHSLPSGVHEESVNLLRHSLYVSN